MRRLAASALCVLVALAGCVGGVGDSSPAAGCSLPDADPLPTDSPTPTDSGTGQAEGSVSISTAYDGPVSVVLYLEGTDRAVFAKRYPPNTTAIDLGDETVDWRSYRVVIRTDCEVVWDRSVYDYETYDLHVTGDGSVEILQHGER